MYCEECEIHITDFDDDTVCPCCGGELISEDAAAEKEMERESAANRMANIADHKRDRRVQEGWK